MQLVPLRFGNTLEWHTAQQTQVSKERSKGNDAKSAGLQATATASAGLGLRVALKDAHWSALCREPMTCDFVSSSANRCWCLWCRPSPSAPAKKRGKITEKAAPKTLRGRGGADHLALKGSERPDVFDPTSVGAVQVVSNRHTSCKRFQPLKP
jgi:hypothetical protein